MRKRRVQEAHDRFLDSCRSLREGRTYWRGMHPVKRWILSLFSPVPLSSLLPESAPLYSALTHLERTCRQTSLGEEQIQEYHRILLPSSGGKYRKGAAAMRGSTVTPPHAPLVPSLMRKLHARLISLQTRWSTQAPSLDEVLRHSLDLYQELGKIHPFEDANGRVARLALNHLMRRADLPYVILPPLDESPQLMAALQDGHRGHLDPLMQLAMGSLVPVLA